jgi:hypothetical protein
MALLMTLPMACGSDGGGGNSDGGNGAVDADTNAPLTAFRISKMKLLDPHVFLSGLIDLTTTVDGQIQDAIDEDADDPADGILDLNAIVVFQPLDQAGATTPMAISFADCSAPLATTACTQMATTTYITATATNDASATCLEEVAGTTTAEYDAVVPVPAPCFASNAVDVTVNLGSVTLPLKSARISATYSGSPATSLVTGLLIGYVTKADADVITVPVGDNMPTLSSLLKADDMDTDPSGAPENNGWWFYLTVDAGEVTYTVE